MILLDFTGDFAGIVYPVRPSADITDLIVHHSDGRQPINQADLIKIAWEINAVHVARGWPGFAYHRMAWEQFWVTVRPRATYGWHSAGVDNNQNGIGDGNDYGMAVVIPGTYTNSKPSALTLQTIAEGWAWEEQQLGRKIMLSGHRDWWATQCPTNLWPQVKAEIEILKLGGLPPAQDELAQVRRERDALRAWLAEKESFIGALQHDVIGAAVRQMMPGINRLKEFEK